MKTATMFRRRLDGRYWRLGYSNVTSRKKKIPALHQVRDCMAFGELGAMLSERGMTYATTIRLFDDNELGFTGLPPLDPRDLLVLTTRPPLDDKPVPEEGTETAKTRRQIVPRNGGEVEQMVFGQLRRYFAHCDRSVITLSERAATLLPEEFRAYKDIELYSYMRDDIHWYRNCGKPRREAPPPPWTVGFFIHLPRLPRLRCGMIVSFGMCGFTNLVWNRILRVRHADWLGRYRFVMALLTPSKFDPELRPITPAFADDPRAIRLRILASEPLR